jgi:inner membrane protein
MPSPIAHLAAGYAVYRLGRQYEPEPGLKAVGPLPGLLVVTAVFSLLPDLDSVVGFLMRDFGRFHNNASHSLFAGLCLALAFAGLMWWQRRQFAYWFAVAFVSYGMHLLMDMATISRGIMLFWPMTDARYLSPVTLFYGLHWSDGWITIRHLWTLLTELVFIALVWGALHFRPWRTAEEG